MGAGIATVGAPRPVHRPGLHTGQGELVRHGVSKYAGLHLARAVSWSCLFRGDLRAHPYQVIGGLG